MIDVQQFRIRRPLRIQQTNVLCDDPCGTAEVEIKAAIGIQLVSDLPGSDRLDLVPIDTQIGISQIREQANGQHYNGRKDPGKYAYNSAHDPSSLRARTR